MQRVVAHLQKWQTNLALTPTPPPTISTVLFDCVGPNFVGRYSVDGFNILGIGGIQPRRQS